MDLHTPANRAHNRHQRTSWHRHADLPHPERRVRRRSGRRRNLHAPLGTLRALLPPCVRLRGRPTLLPLKRRILDIHRELLLAIHDNSVCGVGGLRVEDLAEARERVLRVGCRGERAREEHERLPEELEERERGEDDGDVEGVRGRGVGHECDRGCEDGDGVRGGNAVGRRGERV